MSEARKKNWGGMALLTAACAAWQIYDMATEVEAPSQAVAALHYFALVLALIGFVGSSALYIKSLSSN